MIPGWCLVMKLDWKRFRKRLLLSAAVWLGFCFTFLFFGPLELVAFSADSLVYSYADVLWPLIGVSAAVWAAASLLTAVLKGGAFRAVLAIVTGVTVAGYLQSAFLNGQMGKLTGDPVQIQWGLALVGLGVWLCVLGALLALMKLKRKLFRKVVVILALALTVMQLAPTVGILAGAYDLDTGGSSYSLSDEGFYEFSAGENVLVIVLDRLDFDYVEAALREDPEVFAGFDGFTVYKNAVSSYARTRPALLHMMTGAEELIYQKSSAALYDEAWTYGGRELLADVAKAGYSAEFYTKLNYLFSDMDYARRHAMNFYDGKQAVNTSLVVGKLLRLSAYRYCPALMKNLFWADTNYYNEGALLSSGVETYQYNDAVYMKGFTESTADRERPAFKLYHFFGPHAPYTMDELGQESTESTSASRQLRGNLLHLSALFQRMKALGVYDDATIIITGDHGAAVSDMKPVQKETRVGIFYKPKGASGEAVFSSAPVCTADIPATVLKAMGVDHSAYGVALDETPENSDRVRNYYKTIYVGEPLKEAYLYTYEIRGDASAYSNWVMVEEGEIPYGYN